VNETVSRRRLLSVQNGFHEFENLCRHLARVSICPNIIPASGPVSAGGDQGRDFETFATFLGKGSAGEDIAFACTLQKDNVSAKVRSDIGRITCGRHVDAVYVFLAADLEISRVHDLQSGQTREPRPPPPSPECAMNKAASPFPDEDLTESVVSST